MFAVWAQRVKFLFDLHLIRGARVLGQEPHHALLGDQGVGGLGRGGGSRPGGLEFQRGHPAVLQRLGQDLLDGLIIRPVWDLSALTNCGFKSPVGTKLISFKKAKMAPQLESEVAAETFAALACTGKTCWWFSSWSPLWSAALQSGGKTSGTSSRKPWRSSCSVSARCGTPPTRTAGPSSHCLSSSGPACASRCGLASGS